jgi:hypothetical protein
MTIDILNEYAGRDFIEYDFYKLTISAKVEQFGEHFKSESLEPFKMFRYQYLHLYWMELDNLEGINLYGEKSSLYMYNTLLESFRGIQIPILNNLHIYGNYDMTKLPTDWTGLPEINSEF